MKKFLSIILAGSSLALLLPGCEEHGVPTQVQTPILRSATVQTNSGPNLLPQAVVLSGYTVTYNGRTFAGNQTTFTYIVTGPANSYDFRLELPPCAGSLVSFTPPGADTLDNDETEEFNPGIEWFRNPGEVESTIDTFSITFSGLVREGIALVAVQPGESPSQTGFIAGPCARVFDISGTVYNDANTDGIKQTLEIGMGGVTVNLLDSNNVFLGSVVSDASGNYKIESVPLGRYTVQLDTSTLSTTGSKYLTATTPTSLSVTGGPDSPGTNFGFKANSTKLVTDLTSGTLPSNGLTVDFWKKQLAAAGPKTLPDPIGGVKDAYSGGNNNPTTAPVVSRDSLKAYIVKIRALLLPEPFQLGTGDGIGDAFNIMSNPPKTDLQKLRQELLALELNWVSHHGIVGTDSPLQLVLIGWGETLVAGATGETTLSVRSTMSNVTDATAVFKAIDKSSGGGGSF